MSLIKINNISKTYYTDLFEIQAINDITFNIDKGDFIGIIGPSGCGKSTILSILCGLENKSNGEIIINDDIKLGYMLQQDALFEWRTILDNCLIGLEINKTLTDDSKKYVLNLLNTYGLGDFVNSYPSSLSGGMRQRVALIRTLAIKPDILIMDEPFSSLDSQTRINISEDIYYILKNENKTLLLVSHNIDEVLCLCNKIIVLTNRPSTIKNIYMPAIQTNLTYAEKKETNEYNKYYKLIWNDIND